MPKRKFPVCPSCDIAKREKEAAICLQLLHKTNMELYRYYKAKDADVFGSFMDNAFDWACDECLENKKALLANIHLQMPSLTPTLAYFDVAKVCRKCGLDFMFTKEEKAYWYEQLKFHVDSTPVHCVKCRKEVRELKAENKLISDILQKEPQDISVEEYKIVAEVYRKWDKEEKAKYYEAMLVKKSKF